MNIRIRSCICRLPNLTAGQIPDQLTHIMQFIHNPWMFVSSALLENPSPAFCHAGLDWGSVLVTSIKKCAFEKEILEYRLNSFPVHLVDLLPILSQAFVASPRSHALRGNVSNVYFPGRV